MAETVYLDNAGKLDIVARQGDTFELVMQFYDGIGVAIDLTGVVKKMQVRLGKGLVLEFTTANGGIVDSAINVLTFTQTASVMSGIPIGLYEYDLQFTYASGKVKTLVKGLFTLQKQITK